MAMMAEKTGLLEQRLVRDIEGMFFIPAYQRGYRWGVEEVTRLLDDVAESREPRAESREPRAESREPRAESREPRQS
ncbi:hypothetical protein TV39_04795, partial [Arthrobacter sp. SPG23]